MTIQTIKDSIKVGSTVQITMSKVTQEGLQFNKKIITGKVLKKRGEDFIISNTGNDNLHCSWPTKDNYTLLEDIDGNIIGYHKVHPEPWNVTINGTPTTYTNQVEVLYSL
jgi:hypothetical protein